MSFFQVTVVSLLTALVTGLGPANAQAQQTERRIVAVEDADYYGHDYATLKNVTLEACEAACIRDTACQAFTYNTSAQWCFLKSGVGALNTFAGAVAGKVVQVAVQTEAMPAPDLSFVQDWLIEDAGRFATRLAARKPQNASFDMLVSRGQSALAQGDAGTAARAFRGAAALNSDGGEAWLGLAQAVLAIEPADDSERYRLRDEAVSAAIEAVRTSKATATRAAAYAALADALERRDLHRPALQSYKASLALVASPDVQAAFDALHEQYGFRVVDYTVDSDAAAPRICVQFSEELEAGRFDFTPYVTLDGQTPPAVTASGEQLCVDGVAHGERYQVTVRAGIPSVVDETLEKASTFDIYVRDRSPSVRFSGNDFVLPRVGSKGVPAVTVNTSEIEIALYRIGERGLAGAVGDGPFLRQLDQWDAERLAEDTGVKIWSGTMAVKSALNDEVTTIFPVDDALPERRPGVYVMTAKTTDGKQEYWEPLATQWFIVSDIGVTTLLGNDGLHVFARSLETAEPLEGVAVQLIARNNELLGEAVTDARGMADFGAGMTRGTGGLAPGVLTAAVADTDFTFVDLTRSGFDLSDRGVAGRPAPGPLDVFLYTERGVYRPGETVYLTALVRDDTADAVSGPPLTLVVKRPDGVEDRRIVSREDSLGGHVFNLPMIGAAMRGSWTAAAYSDPKGKPVAEIDFLVEDFVPDRIEFDLTTAATALPAEQPIDASVDGRFLYGTPAADLRLEGDITVSPTSTLPAWPNYRFGLDDEEVTPVRETLTGLPRTDADGKATFPVAAPALPETTRPLEAKIAVRMREAGGRAVERDLTLPITQTGPMVGVRPLFSDDSVPERSTASFDVIVVGADGGRVAETGLRWELTRIERSFQWYRGDGRWSYDPVTYSTRIASGTVDATTDGAARLAADVDWGRYRLEVASASAAGPVTSIEFTAGWYVETSEADSPDTLELSLDKPSYAVGDTATVTIASRFAGKAIVNVIGETLLETREIDVTDSGTTVQLTVGEDWTPGAYVTATVIRPMNQDGTHMPARAIGLSWLEVDTVERTLDVALDLPEVARPRETLTVPASIAGLEAGEQAYLTVAAVDVGILNLTSYEPPAPEDWYYGQRALSTEIRDIYGSLIDGLNGETGRIRSGGGEAGKGLEGSPPTQEPVSLFSGIVTADADGKATVSFDIPEFNGTLRVMAVAWSKDEVGHGVKDVIVRDPVVMVSSLPRFLAPGDDSRLRLDIDNADGPGGSWRLEVASAGVVTAGTPEPATMFNLAEKARTAVTVPLAASRIGQDRLTVSLVHESGLTISQNLNIGVRGGEPPVVERRVVSLEPGKSLTLDGALVADRVAGSGFVNLSITQAGALDVPSILAALDRYPYGCAEQITSRGMPLLYLSSVAGELGLSTEPELRERVEKAIAGVLAKQSGSGSFGLWGPGQGDLWLDAYVTEFLTRAREAGYSVPDLAFTQALDSLSNTLAYTDNIEDQGSSIAYALYVLARNKRAAISDLRYYVDTQLDRFSSPLAQAQLGAALAFYGENGRARNAFDAALGVLEANADSDGYRTDYGSRLRDGAATLTLIAESGIDPEPMPALIRIVDAERAGRRYTSTQEDGWMLMAAHALLAETASLELEEDGVAVDGNLMRRYSGERLDGQPVTVTNRGDRAIDAVITVSGVPLAPRGAEANGFTISRTYYDLDGNAVPVGSVAQNTRLVVVLDVTEQNAWPSRVLVVDMLPAGFEIDNPNLVNSADLSAFSWLPEDVNPAHVEFRDDRFVAAFAEDSRSERGYKLAYVVRAVSPGAFVHPPAYVEDMYRPYLNARGEGGRIEVLGARP
ncbi:alpha-2-macroglobulin family protein [Microbaculum marinisediminis]|uniref:Alpha-2-macroglobulin family protein n=1 Tax=Microbaculum marinisediminis TaxID=2931392 RepID=A0AAW5QVV9_9HYPH|nr:alpha-2-macroglobulin family protein [Microbaculum sp. A6E488]MCT8972075.1 alpha-2-macroglobulin family protein [Microbaculum sp. A6E488]